MFFYQTKDRLSYEEINTNHSIVWEVFVAKKKKQ
jgi:hypothetical protein